MDKSQLLSAVADVAKRQAAIRARDAALLAELTSTPYYVDCWDEYAVITLAGHVVYGRTASECLSRKVEADEVWARHQVTA